MSGNTPGPWNVDEKHAHPQALRVLAGRQVIADVNVYTFACGDNARLIAAAPTMAEELREQAAFIRRFLVHLVPKSSWVAGHEVNSWAAAEIPDWELRQRLEGLEAAIAKAEGR